MNSLNAVQYRSIAKKFVIGQTNVDQDVALRMKYVGTGTVTSVTVTTGTDITMVTSDGGTDAYTWANYATLGALADKINSDGIFQVKILDGLRSETTAGSRFINGAISASSDGVENVYDMLWDTNTAGLRLAYRLTYDRTFGTNQKLADGHRVTLQEVVTSLTLGVGADAGAWKIYECAPASRGATETLLISRTPTTGSVETWNVASGNGGITAADGNDLVFIVSDGTSFATTDYIRVSGIRE